MAEQALRVLGLAYKIVDKAYDDPTTNNVEQDLIFAGLVGMIDPERPEAKAAVAEAKSAGIRTVMITGDHQITAAAIASRLGILEAGSDKDKSVITGAELDKLSLTSTFKTTAFMLVYLLKIRLELLKLGRQIIRSLQ